MKKTKKVEKVELENKEGDPIWRTYFDDTIIRIVSDTVRFDLSQNNAVVDFRVIEDKETREALFNAFKKRKSTVSSFNKWCGEAKGCGVLQIQEYVLPQKSDIYGRTLGVCIRIWGDDAEE